MVALCHGCGCPITECDCGMDALPPSDERKEAMPTTHTIHHCAECGKAIRRPLGDPTPKGPVYCVPCGASIFLGTPKRSA